MVFLKDLGFNRVYFVLCQPGISLLSPIQTVSVYCLLIKVQEINHIGKNLFGTRRS